MKRLMIGLVTVMMAVAPQVVAAQSAPIVVLEYPAFSGGGSGAVGAEPDNIFVSDPDHTARHRVQPDETLSHIITEHYAGRSLICLSCRWPL